MKNLNTLLVLFICLSSLPQVARSQTNSVPPPYSPPPPPLDEGQTWEDWESDQQEVTFIHVRGSENPVTNIWKTSFAEFKAMPDYPDPPTDEQLEYARIWRKPRPRIVHKCRVPVAPPDPRYIVKAKSDLNGKEVTVEIRIEGDQGFYQGGLEVGP